MREHRGFDYERTDIASIGVAWIGAGLALFVFLTPLLMPFLFPRSMQHNSPGTPPAMSADAPRLALEPRKDLQRFRQREIQLSDTYGWSDRKRGRVRIPVAQAMTSLLNKGLPGWPSR